MKFYLILIAFVISFQMMTFAQTKDITSIDDYYSKIQEYMNDCVVMDYQDPIYCNNVIENKYKAVLPDGISDQVKISYWYDDNPSMYLGMDDEQPEDCLLLVSEDKIVKQQKYHTELVYEKGHLIFALVKIKSNGSNKEVRMYFDGSKMTKQIGTVNTNMYSKDTILQMSKKYMKKFLNSFGVSS